MQLFICVLFVAFACASACQCQDQLNRIKQEIQVLKEKTKDLKNAFDKIRVSSEEEEGKN